VDKPVLDDGVTAPRIMPDIHLIPELWKIDGYSKISSYLRQTFELETGKNFFEFPYDWRRDNRVAARKLAADAENWLHAWRNGDGPDDAQLILIGHSMGGLVARYYLECLEGWRDTKTLITLGTPFRGSLNALGFVANGFTKGIGPFDVDLSELLRSFTSVYQLLPIYPCYDEGQSELKRAYEVAIPNVEQDRAKAARAFHDEISKAVQDHEDDDEYRRNAYETRTVIGTFQPTWLSAKKRPGGVELLRTYPGSEPDGDGTVPRVSASPPEYERERNAMRAAEQHASLQNDQPVLVDVAGAMTTEDLGRFRVPPGISLGLDVDDLFSTEEEIPVRVHPEKKVRDQLQAVVEDAGTGAEVASSPLRPEPDGDHTVKLAALPEGAYRLRISGGTVEPVTDVFVVVQAG
jgi:pimeloyl-ACP methyl ester carboxylesterase